MITHSPCRSQTAPKPGRRKKVCKPPKRKPRRRAGDRFPCDHAINLADLGCPTKHHTMPGFRRPACAFASAPRCFWSSGTTVPGNLIPLLIRKSNWRFPSRPNTTREISVLCQRQPAVAASIVKSTLRRKTSALGSHQPPYGSSSWLRWERIGMDTHGSSRGRKAPIIQGGQGGLSCTGGARKCHGWMPTAAFRLQHGGLGAILARPINERHFGRVLNWSDESPPPGAGPRYNTNILFKKEEIEVQYKYAILIFTWW
jgi:hypothetical protein